VSTTARYEIEILAPTGGGRMTLDTYTTGVNYAVDHADERILVKLQDGRDEKGRPVIAASYGARMRTVVRPVEEAP
jgi:hypothetical protein